MYQEYWIDISTANYKFGVYFKRSQRVLDRVTNTFDLIRSTQT
jgi:hypothetical protein